MDLESMTREELIQHIKEMTDYMDNVVVFWGGKKEFRETFEEVAKNERGEYTDEEARNAQILIQNEQAFDDFIDLVRSSFEKGGINYVLSEKISALMQEMASRHAKGQ